MKIKDIINSVSKTNGYNSDISRIAEEFHINCWDYEEQERLKEYFVASWYCTDTLVGMRVYFLDDKPVATSIKPARKSDEKFYWVSNETYMEVFNYVLTFVKHEAPPADLINMDEDMGEGFNIQFCGQRLHHQTNAMMGNIPVKILKDGEPDDAKYICINQNVIVEHDGKQETVDINSLTFPFELTT